VLENDQDLRMVDEEERCGRGCVTRCSDFGGIRIVCGIDTLGPK
jgi:hypothetical protein